MARYKLGNQIGAGGMGVVHRGWKLLPNGGVYPVAIKRIRPQHCKEPNFRTLLDREARVCLQVSHGHPNLVTVFDIDETDEQQLFLVMEYVSGITLADMLKMQTTPAPVVRRIALEVLEALAYIHGLGIVHRDISPSNILISEQGEVKISDFGLATVGATGMGELGFRGKTAYASPEAIQCIDAGLSTDLYSWAAVMYQMFNGEPPFGFGNYLQINKRMMDWAFVPLPVDVPVDLREAILGLLRHCPEQRAFDSAEALIADIDQRGLPVADTDELVRLVAQVSVKRPAGTMCSDAQTIVIPTALEGTSHASLTTASPRRVGLVRRSLSWILASILASGIGAIIGFQYGAAPAPSPPHCGNEVHAYVQDRAAEATPHDRSSRQEKAIRRATSSTTNAVATTDTSLASREQAALDVKRQRQRRESRERRRKQKRLTSGQKTSETSRDTRREREKTAAVISSPVSTRPPIVQAIPRASLSHRIAGQQKQE